MHNALAQFVQPVRSVADYAADYDQADLRKQGIQRNALMMQEAQAAMADRERLRKQTELKQNALMAITQSGAAPENVEAALLSNPMLYSEGNQRREDRLKAGELQGKVREAELKNQQMARFQAVQQAASFTTPDDAIAHLNSAVTRGELPMQSATAFQRMIQSDPQWQLKLVMGAMNPEKMADLLKPHLQTRNRGGTTDTLATNQITGVPTVTSSVQNTQSPESVAQTGLGYARLAEDKRQFGITDAHAVAKEASPASITEGERNAGGYASRMVEASKLLDQFEGKGRATYKTDALGGVPLVGRALQTSAMNSEQQRYRQAQEDWVRAKLRKESGASIAPDEMAREISAYFPEPGDLPENIAQKKQAREVANAAMVQSAGRGAPKAGAAPAIAPGSVLKFDAQGNPVQ